MEVDCQVASESNTGSDRLEDIVFVAKIHLRLLRIMWYITATQDTIFGCHHLPHRQAVRCKAIVWQDGAIPALASRRVLSAVELQERHGPVQATG